MIAIYVENTFAGTVGRKRKRWTEMVTNCAFFRCFKAGVTLKIVTGKGWIPWTEIYKKNKIITRKLA